MSLAIWDHTVLSATRHKRTHPALTPASELGWYTMYLPQRDGRLSWPRWLVDGGRVFGVGSQGHHETGGWIPSWPTVLERQATAWQHTDMEQSSIGGNGSHPLAYFCHHEDTLTRRFLPLFWLLCFSSHQHGVLYQLFSSTRSSQQPTRVLRATIPQALLAPCLYTNSARPRLWISLKVKVSANR